MRRFRCSTLSQIVFVLLIFSTVKLTILFYNDLQRESANNIGGLSLPIERTQIEWKEKLVTNVDRKQIENLRNFVKEKNEKQKIFNEKIFSSPRTRFVLLIQVHTRIVYLRKFIEMLRSVEKIEETLLIFSHDFIDENINKLVEKIDFVPVMQIFYPFSQQVYPDEFPGADPFDCPRDIIKNRNSKNRQIREKALKLRCRNAPFPDKFGHYREVSIVQIKHHWWWKLNFVFNSVRILQNRTDLSLLLLEEDFYLSPDALIFLEKMHDEKEKLCPDCWFFTLGNLEKTGRDLETLADKVSIAYWHARYNLGMTISHSFWNLLVKHAEEVCNVDDYNWDWSLVHLVQKRLNFPRVMFSSSTRVVHLGSCGTHHKKTCSNESDIARWKETEKFYNDHRKKLFPKKPLSIQYKFEVKRPMKNTNGGWSDIRDRQLCLSFALNQPINFTVSARSKS